VRANPRRTTSVPRPAGAARRRSLRAVVIAAAATWTFVVGCDRGAKPAAEPAGTPWNVLLITFDTTRADHLGCYGYEHGETRTLDLMARNSLRFERCYTPATLTLPAHASLLTGLYPFQHGLQTNGVGPLDESVVTLAEVLKDNGYATGAVVAASVLEPQYGLSQGFEFYDATFDPGAAKSRFEYAERPAAQVTDAAIAWLEQVRGRKYFLWVHYYDAHAPYAPPGFNPATAPLAPYDAEIAYADRELDRLLQKAAQIKVETRKETLLVFAADHGEALWEHGEPTHGLFVYDECLRVPLIVHVPGASPTIGVVNEPVSLVDVFPSVLSWLGIQAPQRVHGRPLPTTASDAPSARSRAVYCEAYLGYYTYGWSPIEGVVVGSEKFVSAPRPELYDLSADPKETNNLYAPGDARSAALQSALDAVHNEDLGRPKARAGEPVQDPESVRKLQALGYAGAIEPDVEDRASLADPKDRIELHRNIIQAQAEIDVNNFDKALELVNNVVTADPDNPRALFLLVDLLKEAPVRDKALGFVRARMEKPLRPPFDALMPLSLGIAAAQRGEMEEARRLFETAHAADPDDAEACYNLAQAVAQLGERDKAIELLKRAVALDPQNPRNGLALGLAYEVADRWEDAAGVYESLLASDPENWIVLNNSAWALHKLGRNPDQAIARAEQAVRGAPADPRPRHTLACVLTDAGRTADAVAHLLEALRLQPDYAAAHYQLGCAYEVLGDPKSAVPSLERAVELSGQPPPAWLEDARQRLARLRGP